MNETTATLFDEFATAYRGENAPDVLAYLERAGDDADALAEVIDRFLQAVPARAATEEEIVLMQARLEREPPILVMRLRRKLTRVAIVETLISTLGLDPAKQAKVYRYYHELETGSLDPKPVDGRVWDVLSDVFSASARRLAGLRPPLPPPSAPAVVYERMPSDSRSRRRLFGRSSSVRASVDSAAEEQDEIDRLFTGSA